VKKDQLTTAGAEVREVSSGSAGDKAGLEGGDIITAGDGNPISSSDALVATIRSYQRGDTIKITLTRDDDQKTVDVKLGSDLDKDNPGSGSDGAEAWPDDDQAGRARRPTGGSLRHPAGPRPGGQRPPGRPGNTPNPKGRHRALMARARPSDRETLPPQRADTEP